MDGLGAPAAPPFTYLEWSAWLDAFVSGGCDEDLLALGKRSATAWTDGMAQLFAVRMFEAMSGRLNGIGLTLEARLKQVRAEAELSLALVRARREFAALARFAALPVLQEPLRERLSQLVRSHLDARQKALDESARSDRSGRLARAVRANPLNVGNSPAPPILVQAATPPVPAAGPVRRILL
jgi:hypothetical protein